MTEPWRSLERFTRLGEDQGVVVADPPPSPTIRAHLEAALEEDGERALGLLCEPGVTGAQLFGLAVAMRNEADAVRELARDRVRAVCGDEASHVLRLAKHLHALGGWGRGTRRAVAAWYEQAPLHALRAAPRAEDVPGWSHRDVLRLTHPKTNDPERNAAFAGLVRGTSEAPAEAPPAVEPPPAAAPGGPTCWVTVDVSGSMRQRVVAADRSAAEAARDLVIGLSSAGFAVKASAFSADGWSLGPDPLGRASALFDVPHEAITDVTRLEAALGQPRLGATNPALPMRRAQAEAEAVDLFVVVSLAFADDERARARDALARYAEGRARAHAALVGLADVAAPRPAAGPMLDVRGPVPDLPTRLRRWLDV